MNDRERLVRLMRLPREKFEKVFADALVNPPTPTPEAVPTTKVQETIRLAQQDPARLARLDALLAGDDPLADWIAKELAEHDRVPLLGFRGRVTLPLDEVFVQLQVFAGRLDDSRDELHALGPAERVQHESSRHLSPTECLDFAFKRDRKGVVFLGLPGAGKTTLLKHLFTRLAHGDAASMGLDPHAVPVFLRVASIVDFWRSKPLAEIIRERARAMNCTRAGDALTREDPPLLVMLDGLDEVRDAWTRTWVCRQLESELVKMSTARFVVTCRYAAWKDLAVLDDRFQAVDVLLLQAEQVQRYVRCWFPAVERSLAQGHAPNEDRAKERADRLLDVLARQQRSAHLRLRELIGNPLMLSTVCLIFLEDNTLPEQRAALYDRATKLLLQNATQRWGEAAALPEEPSRRVLERVAWEMHSREWVERDEAEVLPFVADALRGRTDISHDAAGFLKTARDESGILAGYDVQKVRFLHLTFQEYLASCYARNHDREEELAKHAEETFWREVILLAATQEGRFAPFVMALHAQGRVAAAKELLHECLADLGSSPASAFEPLLDGVAAARALELRWRKLPWLKRLFAPEPPPPTSAALDAAVTVLSLWSTRDRERDAVRAWAIRYSHDPYERLREVARSCLASADNGGHAFTDPLTGIAFLWVPPGSFWMGSSSDPSSRVFEPLALEREGPVHKVTLTEGYWLSRFPVTNGEYLRYIHATNAIAPGSFSNARLNDPLQPVCDVDFSDARKFCVWLTQVSLHKLGRVASIPSEAEWEYAARGSDGRKYPWGNDPPTVEHAVWGLDSRTGVASRVGGRPSGQGPFGHEEMAGNVWEWCRDSWRNTYVSSAHVTDPCHHEDGSELRVVRGGSWYVIARFLRCASRLGVGQGSHSPDLGFRVVVRVSRQRTTT